jgi:2-succinyl-5-enolpyruvyl-6-hydroxy-3-cyclohexene-1-carboxylate synthase
MNVSLSKKILEDLGRWGVRDIVLCAGARNSPFVNLLSSQEGFRVFPFPEERSASFFALGRIKRFKKPVAVITTSGTAVAELMPATLEAHYSALPLILITADRPKRFRGTGSPQTIDQAALFGNYVERAWDLEGTEEFAIPGWTLLRPLHINVCFEEPLIDAEVQASQFYVREEPLELPPSPQILELQHQILSFFIHCKRPLVILGGLEAKDKNVVKKFLLSLQAPIYAEAISGLREDEQLKPLLLKSGDPILNSTAMTEVIDGVLRIGSVPTLRFWRDLEGRFKETQVCHVTAQPFTGLTRGKMIFGDISQLMSISAPRSQWTSTQNESLQRLEEKNRLALEVLLNKYPTSEPGMIHQLSKIIPPEAMVFLGNSLPIREWDLAANWQSRQHEVMANRGVNGIDGMVSTFMGSLSERHSNWLVIGDLTAFYDLAGLWPFHNGLITADFKIIVINNGGGKIFHRMFHNPLFENQHRLQFGKWAEMFGLPYARIQELPMQAEIPRQAIIEVVPNNEVTEQFWNEYDRIWNQ